LPLRRNVFLVDLGQFPEQLLLTLRQLLGSFDDDLHQQVAAPSAADGGHPLVRDTDHFARLCAAGQGMLQRPIERRHFNVRSQGCLAKGNRHAAYQMLAVALEDCMFTDVNQAVQIAARSPGRPGLAFAGQTDAIPAVHPRRDADLQRVPHLHATLPVARWARVGDDRPASAAARAGLLDAEKPLALNDHAVAAAAPTHDWPGPRPRAIAAAVRTILLAGDRYGLGDTAGRFE